MEEDYIPNEVLEEMADEVMETEATGDLPAFGEEGWQQRWARPAVPEELPKRLAFQWTSIDMYTGNPLETHPNPSARGVPGSRQGPVPIVRVYGVTEDGHSVCAHCHGFTPYCYASCPIEFEDTVNNRNIVLREINEKLGFKVQKGEGGRCSQFALGLEVLNDWISIMGYATEEKKKAMRFFKIYVALPTMVPALKRVLTDGIKIPGCGGGFPQGVSSYESNVPFLLRFMIDNAMPGANWLELLENQFRYRLNESEKKSRCQLEIDCVFDSIISHEPVGEWQKIASEFRVLAFDIECQGRAGHFPEAERDPVIQISCVVKSHGTDIPTARVVFTLGGCLGINGADVVTADSEDELLANWAAFVRAVDPDVITGYNTQNFDIPYVLNRAKAIAPNGTSRPKQQPSSKHSNTAKKKFEFSRDSFYDLGRIKKSPARMREQQFQSAQYGKRENIETTIAGRVMFDLLPYMFRNHKLSSYSLNSVCSEFLGMQKEDVHHSIISDLQNGTDDDRHRLAVYCLKDSELVIKLMDKLCVMINYMEMARVTGVPIDFLLSRGQQIKVFSMLLRRCRSNKMLVPHLPKGGGASDDAKYEGATVIEPIKAFYQEPIATLDFASLYPSIMQAYNLCYSTIITSPEELRALSPDKYMASPKCADGTHHFVKAETKRGLLPQILEDLLRARKQAKKDMKLATDPMQKAVQNGRQLALKISANSVYGFTGAIVGQLPCVAIASTVTAYGRQLLLKTREFVEAEYTVDNGYEADAKVVYGDTDSVMVKFGMNDMHKTMPLAEAVASRVTDIFPKPVKLEFEKVYFPYLLMNKKRYAGLLWTNPNSHDYLDAKGLETVRRDNCLLVRQVVDACLRKIIIDRDVDGAIHHAKRVIADLLQNKVDVSLLVITKSLSKETDSKDYKAKTAHAELAKKMKQRDAGTAPHIGDRVPFVFIPGPKGMAAYEKAEDPVYVLDNNLPIDANYYLENQLSKPLTRIFEPIVKNTDSILKGDHTRVVCKPTPVARKGGIMMFANKSIKCLGCKVIIQSGTVCVHCKPKERDIYLRRLKDLNEHERTFGKLWTQCQRCQGSLHQDVLCTNSDCPIFYKRKKVQSDLKDVQNVIARFDW